MTPPVTDDDEIYVVDEEAEVITLDENDIPPVDIDDAMEDLDMNEEDEIEQEEEVVEMAKVVISKHNGPVFCAHFSHRTNKYVITGAGGDDDKGYVWNAETGEVLFECGDHRDSVVACGFSVDDKYAMTADMAGVVNVWTLDGKKVWDFEGDELEWCKWHPSAHVLFAGTETGVFMWKIPSGECKVFQSSAAKSHAVEVLKNGKQLLVGYDGGLLNLWDLKSATSVFSHQEKEDSIICVAAQENGKLVGYGTESGHVKLFNVDSKKHVTTLGKGNDECTEAIAFSPCLSYVACAWSHCLQVWDLTTQRLRYECAHPAGVNLLSWRPSNVIFTSCHNREVRQYNGTDGTLVKQYTGNTDYIYALSFNKDDTLFLTGGEDDTARIFSI